MNWKEKRETTRGALEQRYTRLPLVENLSLPLDPRFRLSDILDEAVSEDMRRTVNLTRPRETA